MLANKKLISNGQAIYRISIAFADLIVGFFVFPSFISTLYRTVLFKPTFQNSPLINTTEYHGDLIYSEEEVLNMLQQRGLTNIGSSRAYFDFVGVFTISSALVSVYTLIAAAADRFVAISRPLKYQNHKAALYAKRIVVTIWLCCVIVALVPVFDQEIQYVLILAIFVSFNGVATETIFAVILIIPVVFMWLITFSTFVCFRFNRKKRPNVNFPYSNAKDVKLQARLLFTLCIMVGVFTLCFLPTFVSLIVQSKTLPEVNASDLLREKGQSLIPFVSAEVVVTIFSMSNSLWNFFIYSARDNKFRKATKRFYMNSLSVFACGNLEKLLPVRAHSSSTQL